MGPLSGLGISLDRFWVSGSLWADFASWGHFGSILGFGVTVAFCVLIIWKNIWDLDFGLIPNTPVPYQKSYPKKNINGFSNLDKQKQMTHFELWFLLISIFKKAYKISLTKIFRDVRELLKNLKKPCSFTLLKTIKDIFQ